MLMPPSPRLNAGWSLIEMIIGLSIVAILIAVSAPNISAWVNNTQIRTAAESLQNGLQLARAEAVRRNTNVSFYLVNTTEKACAVSADNANWIVALTNPEGACDNADNVIQKYSSADGGSRTSIASNQSTITFNGLGRATTGANSICVGITDVNISCVADEPEHPIAVQVSAGGQIKMCRTSRPEGDPQRC